MMGRGHTPFGYRIKNGTAVIIPEEAEKIRNIYAEYLAGQGLIEAARNAGLSLTHSSVMHILQNKHYLGDDFYPAIIDQEIFDAAEVEHRQRMEMMGRACMNKNDPEKRLVKTHFTMKPAVSQTKDPYEKAAYMYSLIESEE